MTFAMEQSRRDDYDTDASLEHSEEEMREQFLDFYDDVLPEFRNAGKVVQFKVIKPKQSICGSRKLQCVCVSGVKTAACVVSGELQL